MLSGETSNTFVVLGLTRQALDPMIYLILGEHAHHYTTDVVLPSHVIFHKLVVYMVSIYTNVEYIKYQIHMFPYN